MEQHQINFLFLEKMGFKIQDKELDRSYYQCHWDIKCTDDETWKHIVEDVHKVSLTITYYKNTGLKGFMLLLIEHLVNGAVFKHNKNIRKLLQIEE